MQDCKNTLEQAKRMMDELVKELEITEEEINSPEYDYIDKD